MRSELESLHRGVQGEKREQDTEREQLLREFRAVEAELEETRVAAAKESRKHQTELAELRAQLDTLQQEAAVRAGSSQLAQKQAKDHAEKQRQAEKDSRAIRAEFAALMEQKNSLEADLTLAVQELENFRDSFQMSEAARELIRKELDEQSQTAERERMLADQERQQLELTVCELRDTLRSKEQRLQELDELYAALDTKYKKLVSENTHLRFSSSSVSVPQGPPGAPSLLASPSAVPVGETPQRMQQSYRLPINPPSASRRVGASESGSFSSITSLHSSFRTRDVIAGQH
jgi:chromosome segregation ATPase